MDWVNKYKELIAILTAFCISFLWLNGKFYALEKDVAVIKAVLIMKNMMPLELAKSEPIRPSPEP